LWWPLLFFQLNATCLILSPFRFEALLVFFVLCGYFFHLKNKSFHASIAWGLGFNVKWFPAFVEFMRDTLLWRKGTLPKRTIIISAAAFSAAALAPNLITAVFAYLQNGEIKNLLYPYLYHLKRPLYFDTLLGVWSIWYYTPLIEAFADKISLAFMLAVCLFKPRQSLEIKIILLCVAMLLFNRVYSTQFHLWFYPFLILFILPGQIMRRAFGL